MKDKKGKRPNIFWVRFVCVISLFVSGFVYAYPQATLISPTNGSLVYYSTSEPCFSWSVANDPAFVSYTLAVSTTTDFPTSRWQYQTTNQSTNSVCWNGGVGWVSKGTSPPPVPGRLQEGVTYYWKVVGTYSTTQTQSLTINSFTVKLYPSAPTPINSTVDSNSWLITWNKPDNTVTYYNIVETNGGVPRSYNNITANSFRPSVFGSTKYDITACNVNGCSPVATQTFNLTTAPSPTTVIANTPDVFSSVRNFTVSWSNVGAAQYYVEYAGSSANDITSSSNWVPHYNGSALQWTEPMNTSYQYNQWRVKACNSLCSVWSYSRTKTFQLQSVASTTSMTSPSDGSQIVFSGTNPCFQWQPDPTASSIVVAVSNTMDVAEKRWQQTLSPSATSICWNGGSGWIQKGVYASEVISLSIGPTFYWRITTTVAAGNSFSPTRSFVLVASSSISSSSSSSKSSSSSSVSSSSKSSSLASLSSLSSSSKSSSSAPSKVGAEMTYEYDVLGRITKVKVDGIVKTEYHYDPAGNRSATEEH